MTLGLRIIFAIAFLFMVLIAGKGLRLTPSHYISAKLHGKDGYEGDQSDVKSKETGGNEEEVGMELYPSGSSLPDCSHACGPCFPCKRVMVSFKCSTESCPIVYRCTCKGKYYHVPSN